jgi:hypothetical protein
MNAMAPQFIQHVVKRRSKVPSMTLTVFHLAARAVELVVERLRLAFEAGDHKARLAPCALCSALAMTRRSLSQLAAA